MSPQLTNGNNADDQRLSRNEARACNPLTQPTDPLSSADLPLFSSLPARSNQDASTEIQTILSDAKKRLELADFFDKQPQSAAGRFSANQLLTISIALDRYREISEIENGLALSVNARIIGVAGLESELSQSISRRILSDPELHSFEHLLISPFLVESCYNVERSPHLKPWIDFFSCSQTDDTFTRIHNALQWNLDQKFTSSTAHIVEALVRAPDCEAELAIRLLFGAPPIDHVSFFEAPYTWLSLAALKTHPYLCPGSYLISKPHGEVFLSQVYHRMLLNRDSNDWISPLLKTLESHPLYRSHVPRWNSELPSRSADLSSEPQRAI